MDNYSKISGKWAGLILYGPEYGKLENEELYFTAELVYDSGYIKGVAKDLNQEIDTGEATINGFIKDGLVSFVKQYEYDSYYDENYNHIVDQNRKGPEIIYTGVYNLLNNSIEGEWEIFMGSVEIDGNEYDELCTGTFKMAKK